MNPLAVVVRAVTAGLDHMAGWLGDRLSAQAQLRVGIASVLASLPFYARLFSTDEPKDIYLMSALALTLTGIAFVVGAEVLLAQEAQERRWGETIERIARAVGVEPAGDDGD